MMRHKVICDTCKKDLLFKGTMRQTCGGDCAKVYDKKVRKEWGNNNKVKLRNYSIKYRKNKRRKNK